MNLTYQKLLLVLLVLSASLLANAQKAVRLSSTTNKKTILLQEGKRVVYKLKGEQDSYLGILESASDSMLIVGGEKIPLSNLEALGRRNKGSGFWTFTTFFFGTASLISIVTPDDDPCPNCIDEGSPWKGWPVVGAGVTAGLFVLGINTISRNSPKDLITKWKLEIVEVSTVSK